MLGLRENISNGSVPHGLFVLRWSELDGWEDAERIDEGAAAWAYDSAVALDGAGNAVAIYKTDASAPPRRLMVTHATAGGAFSLPQAVYESSVNDFDCLQIALTTAGSGFLSWTSCIEKSRPISGAASSSTASCG